MGTQTFEKNNLGAIQSRLTDRSGYPILMINWFDHTKNNYQNR